MKNKLTTAFEQIQTNSRIDVIMAKVNASLIAYHQAGCLDYCEDLLNEYIDDLLNNIAINFTDEKTE